MSTRANIVIKDSCDQLWFYRHSDGYPEGAMPTLQKFVKWLRDGTIRNNSDQAAGWLILVGAEEYNRGDHTVAYKQLPASEAFSPDVSGGCTGWKCGAYEPTTGVHGDIEFLYVIDCEAATITCYDSWDDKGVGDNVLFVDTKDSPWVKPQDD